MDVPRAMGVQVLLCRRKASVLEPSTSVENITYAVDFGELSYAYLHDWREWHGYGKY